MQRESGYVMITDYGSLITKPSHEWDWKFPQAVNPFDEAALNAHISHGFAGGYRRFSNVALVLRGYWVAKNAESGMKSKWLLTADNQP